MEGLHNLKDRICSFENLIGAYRDAAKGKRYRNEVLEFTFNLGQNLHEIQKELLDMTYIVGPYREFYVRYPKPRLVMALSFRDRVVQWAIYRQINPYLDKRYINHSYGCRRDKGTLAAAECLHNWQQLISRKADANEWYTIKGDISKYFYRVDHNEVLKTYKTVSDDAWFSWIIGTIINNADVPFGLPVGLKPDDCPRCERLYEVGMPIGNLTSQETANLFLDRLDRFCKHVLRVHFYVRYMDDFCICIKGKENAWNVFNKITVFLHEELLLDISPKSKIQKTTAPIEFVGYLLTPHGIRMRKKTTRHMKKSIIHIMQAYACGAITLASAKESIQCYMGMCKNCNGQNMRQWIVDNVILTRDLDTMKENGISPNQRKFYSIHENEDGTVDVYLRPDVISKSKKAKCTSIILAVKGVEPFPNMEEDIRSRYNDWCESAEVVYI